MRLSRSRRKFLKLAGAIASTTVGASLLKGCANTPSSSSSAQPAQASSRPTVPEVTIAQGTVAYTNHAWTMLPQKLGYLADVGIKPKTETPRVLLDQQVVPLIQKGEVDFNTLFFGIVAQSLDKVTNIRPVLVYSFWQGNTILAAPDSPYKTVDDFIAEGMPWDKAAAATMAQLKDKQLTTQPNPSQVPWLDMAFGFANMKRQEAKLVAVEDPKAVQLGLAKQVDFVAPGGAVQIYQLQYQHNFRSIMSTRQMMKHMKVETNSPVNNVLNYDTVVCTEEYLQSNRDTVLRYVSALYRTMETMFGSEQEQTFVKYAPFINANTGAEMNPESIKFIFTELDPFFRWQDQAKVYTDKSFRLQYENLYGFHIENYIKNGTLPKQDYDLGKLFAGKQIWQELADYQTKSDQFIAKAKAETLSAERKELFDTGQRYYDMMDYLDAFRFMEAAFA
ncbi:MAG: hypothetical protein MUF49_32370 [Oculatellaceae cyanobacterium Prado106]|jgi:ABC-type nitrate/sulfonate/bicarbonate transport system substrate-binding protein|nr:hypothetical protein [Oculatellaceae cyanobacterium Prado106]